MGRRMSELDKSIKEIADLNPPVPISGLPDNFLISFIGMADVSESGRIIYRHDRYLREVKFGFTRFIEGDILFAKITPCMENGKGAIAQGLRNKYGFGSTEFHVLRNKQNGDAGFIYQILESPDFRLSAEARMTGSAGQKRVPSDFFDFYKTFIPTSLPEQRKIARILYTVDAVIEKSEAAIAKYKAIKSGMMRDLFTRGIDLKTGKLRPRYEDAPELYKQGELGWVPKEWEVELSLGFCKEIADGTHDTPKPIDGDGVPLITSKNLQENGDMNFDTYRISFGDAKAANERSYVKTGDILFGMIGTLGNPVVFDGKEEIACKNVGIFRFDGDAIRSNYFYWFLNSRIAWKQFDSILTGSSQSFLGLNILRGFLVLKPSVNEMRSISTKLNSIKKSLSCESVYLKKQQQLKAALMSDLLTGKVRVKYNEEKVEAVL